MQKHDYSTMTRAQLIEHQLLAPNDEIWWRNREWIVTRFGMNALRPGGYPINQDRLGEIEEHWRQPGHFYGWINHVGLKRWDDYDPELFFGAYLAALALHGVRIAGRKLRQSIEDTRKKLTSPVAIDKKLQKLFINPNDLGNDDIGTTIVEVE